PIRRPPRSRLFPYTTLSRSVERRGAGGGPTVGAARARRPRPAAARVRAAQGRRQRLVRERLRPLHRLAAHSVAAASVRARSRDRDRKSTRLNSSHVKISYAV